VARDQHWLSGRRWPRWPWQALRARTPTRLIWAYAPAPASRPRLTTRRPRSPTRRAGSRSPAPAPRGPVARTIPVRLSCSSGGRRRRFWRADCRRRSHPPKRRRRDGSRLIISTTSLTFLFLPGPGLNSPRPLFSSSPPRSSTGSRSPTVFPPSRPRRCSPRGRFTWPGTSAAAGTDPFPARRQSRHCRRSARRAAGS
jgi:hypothetical protein